MKTTWLTNVSEYKAAELERELSRTQDVFVTMPRATEHYTSQQLFEMGMVAIYRVEKD